MKVTFETVVNDPGSSFRVMHLKEPVSELSWQYHYHPEIELVCVKSGPGTRHVGYHKSSYSNGDLVLIGANVPHSGFSSESVDPHEEIVVQFREEIFMHKENILELEPIRDMFKMAKYGINYSESVRQKIIPLLDELLTAEKTKRYFIMFDILTRLAESQNYQLLNEEVMPYQLIAKNKQRLQIIFTHLETHFAEEISIEMMANLTNMTVPAFCNFFKKATQMTFMEFVNRYRINKACNLLIQGYNISESCYQSGFNNVPYFNRVFKKYTNKTPSDFRKEMVFTPSI